MSWFDRDRYPVYPNDHGLPIDESSARLGRFCGLIAVIARLNHAPDDIASPWHFAAIRFDRAAGYADLHDNRSCNDEYRTAIRELEAAFEAPISRDGFDRLWVASRSAHDTAVAIASLRPWQA